MTGRLDWRSRALLATTAVAMAVAATVAFLTLDVPLLPPRRAKAPTIVAAQITPPVPAPELKLPTAEPPPAPTAADFTVKPADLPAPPAPAPAPATEKPNGPTDLASLTIEEVRSRATANDIAAMEELARRLIQGTGVAKDPQAGAGWLLRAAEAGSAQAAFNVGVMYERGFVVERDSGRAVEWYRKAADGNMPAAKHNLALMLRDGKGAPRDVARAVELLQSAARQGMAASMFSLGDMYERGDAGAKDAAAALAWFAIAAEFERQINRGEETALARAADQRSQALQRVLTPAELQRAQQLGQTEFRAIAQALAPRAPAPAPADPPSPSVAAAPSASPARDDLNWPKAPADQIRLVQQGLADLQLLRDKPDGMLGPMTRNAIRDFQRAAGLRATGEPSKDVYVALRQALLQRDVATRSPLPLPPKPEPGAPAAADLVKPGPDAWPPDGTDQVRAIQRLLRDMKILTEPADGQLGAATRAAIREYERLAGLKETGEPSKLLFDSMKETRALMTPKGGSN
jgi:TPR repeat protein/peptidoglycan hydrolase-like protein with peptidoglycan-binding domain